MVLRHARQHLEIHSRSKGHSAVAGAAYRLGLRLYDERAGVWHDYRRRALGEEIVRALTVAPEGAPTWASDPAQLWNAVEASEKRKDAQVAYSRSSGAGRRAGRATSGAVGPFHHG